MTQQAWSFKTIEKENLRYWGNDGYQDNSSAFYRYDNFVANHKNVKNGDIVIITNRDEVLGISVVNKITEKNIDKKRNKCPYPSCNAKKIHRRNIIKPEWRCDNGHEFNNPKIVYVKATEFIATYEDNYKRMFNVSMPQLITKTPRYNVQMSIQEIDFYWAYNLLFSESTIIQNIQAEDADTEFPILSSEDQRKLIEKCIKQRRGQKKFRDQLIKSFSICAVTGCELVDILEAAHIDAYRNDTHNNISNGLLLRSDIHTLFDLNLCAIDPQTNKIHFSKLPLIHGYQQFEGNILNVKHKLSHNAILKRWEIFIKK